MSIFSSLQTLKYKIFIFPKVYVCVFKYNSLTTDNITQIGPTCPLSKSYSVNFSIPKKWGILKGVFLLVNSNASFQ
jgi:hypothetical protein